jgi:zinc protease
MTNSTTRHSSFYYWICLLLVAAIFSPVNAQSLPEPARERLLNGLNVLFWQRPGDGNVLLKLRVQSGAAFDLAGKGGTMALLGDALFPDPATREYVAEQLGGRLEVSTNYDAIDITMSGKTSGLERMVDLLRSAVVTMQLSPEIVARLHDARVKRMTDQPASSSEIADQAIAARLFGNFPYGHPVSGTLESLAKIERGDLMLARERFINADNATLVVIGGVEKPRLMRALHQLLGQWQKGDRAVPLTFRQPNAPDGRVLAVNQPGATTADVRLAVRGLAQSDRDAAAASMLALIARDRWQAGSPELSSAFVRHEAHALPGLFVLGASVPTASASKAISSGQQVLRLLAQTGPTAAELEKARAVILAEVSRRTSEPESIADLWLDSETFKSPSYSSQTTTIGSLTIADMQRVASRLFKDVSVATVVVGDSEQLKSGFGGNIEVRGEKPEVKTATDPAMPAKKP